MTIDARGLILRAGKTRQREVVLPALEPPAGLRVDLLNVYLRVVRKWGRIIPATVIPAYGLAVRDSVEDVERGAEEAAAAMNRLVITLSASLEDWVVRVEQWHRGRFAQSFTPYGVDLSAMLGRGDVRVTLQAVLLENVALIRSLNDQMRNGISGAVFRGLTDRTPSREVARQIREVTGAGRARAELIAADQLQKLTGRLDQERQQQVGGEEFDWAHSRKRNPRKEHQARDGKRYRWDSDVGRNDPPGRAIRCGCRARFVIPLE